MTSVAKFWLGVLVVFAFCALLFPLLILTIEDLFSSQSPAVIQEGGSSGFNGTFRLRQNDSCPQLLGL